MGRTREFDIDEAVKRATRLFWEKGYEGTSLVDLTGAMGITPPSFYFAFKSKAALFRMVLDRYRSEYLGFAEEALAEPTARRVAECLLNGYADLLTTPKHPPGCLAMNSALSMTDADGVREELRDWRQYRKGTLRKRFQKAIESGDLPPDANPETLAQLVMVVAWGMGVEARSGMTRREMRRVVAAAMQAWPN